MAQTEPDKWKSKCLKLAQELDEYQARWEHTEKLVVRVLVRLICVCEGHAQFLDPYLAQLREALSSHILDETSLQQLDAGSDALWRASEEARSGKATVKKSLHRWFERKETSNETGSGGLHRHLLQLLEEIEIPPALTELGRQVSHSLKQGCALEEALDGTAQLLAKINARLQQERAEIEAFLGQLTARLQVLEAQTQNIGRVLYASNGNWNETLTVQVDHLRAQTLKETNLETLKLVITERLDVLTGQLRALCEEEANRNAEVVQRIAALTERLGELEQESKDLRQRLRLAHQQALYDSVTGLPNRKAVDEHIAQEFSRWQRFHQPLSLLVWDIDHFKQINDRFGHQAGDKALRIVGQVLRNAVRAVDFVGRYGGEEFVMLLPGTDLEDALKVAEKLREAVKRCGFNSRGKPVPVTISCGLTCARVGDTPTSLFERADKALYQAKQAGRDRCVSR